MLTHTASETLERLRLPAGRAHTDAYEALVELTSPICAHADEALAALDALRAALRAAGATAIGAGLHPAGTFGDVRHVPAERYRAIAAELRGLLRRTPTAALHVHVGMPDPETAIHAFNGLRRWLPLIQGLAASSPFWHGLDSGLASARSAVFRAFPRAEVPRAFADFAEYEETIAALRAAGVADYTFVWWDVRPHPRLGTIEVRAMDGQSALWSVAGLAALIHGLARHEAQRPPGDEPPACEAIAESSFRASRDGLAATILHDGSLRPLREVAAAALALARPHACELGSGPALEGVERILREGNGADRQRAAFAAGGMPGLLARLAEETAAPYR